MSLADVLSMYLNLNLMIVIGFLGLGLFALLVRITKSNLGSVVELKLHYAVLTLILVLSVIHPMLPKHEVFSPAAKVWSAQSISTFSDDYSLSGRSGYLSLPTAQGTSSIKTQKFAIGWGLLGSLFFIFGGFIVYRDFNVLYRIKKGSFLIRRIGRVSIFISDFVSVPFSYWLPNHSYVVVPSSMIERHRDLKMAIHHELQHHRHGDTKWVYLMWGIRLICIFNPAIHLWIKWISEIQEFACDETLVDQNKVESQAYARCLVEVAQTAIDQKLKPVGATGLMFLVEGNLLKRRIEKMLSKQKSRIGRSITVGVGLVLATVMGVAAFASKGLVQDRRVSLSQAKAMAEKAQSDTGFPVVVNDLVLAELNRYIGTPEGRQFMRDSLARMENYKPTVTEHLQRYGVPQEIMAIPIIESGYQNLAERPNSKVKSAGIWMFIRSTARNYGLRVDDQKDERLDVPILTDAAMRYLQSNHLRFKDWHLSALAYYIGEDAVQEKMDELDTKDAWTIVRSLRRDSMEYLPKVMAAILIMRNPESVN